LDFVAAAEEAGRDNPRLRFVLAGDGELRTLVEAAARDSVLGERFRLLGWRRDIPDLLSALDVFVLTSRLEALPRAVLQAMVAGVPVVATAVGGTPEVVENGTTGLLVAPDAPSEVARAVSLLGGDPALRHRLAAAARSRVDEQFDIRRMVRTLDDLYAELLSEITLVGTARERG
jgi:glycosyltransferase involved in cell wall biosynthesis